jgi:hypothetical protein
MPLPTWIQGRAWRAFLIAAVSFALLMIPWPGLERAYSYVFRTGAEISFSMFWFGGDPRFEYQAPTPENNGHDVYVRVRENDGHNAWYITTSSRGAGYFPNAVFLALLIATPISRKRRLRALIVGGLLVHLYVTFQLWLNLLDGLWKHIPRCPTTTMHSTFMTERWWQSTLGLVLDAFKLEPTVFVIVPVLAWIISAVRKSDLETWVGRTVPEPG